VVVMKIISYNVRGLGGGEKRVEVRKLVLEKNPRVLCIQESKLSMVNDMVVKSFWGDSPFGYSFQQSVGASGGLVTVWDPSRVVVFSSMRLDHALIIKGKDLSTNEDFMVCNVYAPCDLLAKKQLWDRLHILVTSNVECCLCVCGDFNSVRSVEERKGRATFFRQGDADIFNSFIHDSLLIDLPICGRLFSWYRGDGVSMSRLDRFLLSNKWCEKWPNCVQVAFQRGLSDHVPVMLYVDDMNWGPRPLRMLKCWSDYPGYSDFVRETWGTFTCQGWGGFVLKQKLKMMKASLKEWHSKHFQNLDGRMSEVKNKMAWLDEKGESSALAEEEVNELHDLSVKLHSLSQIQNSMNWQKSRMNWLREGDANSKFFHGCMSSRRRQNAINVVNVDGVSVEGVSNIRTAVFHHFANHFKVVDAQRPDIGSLQFRKLTFGEAGNLTKPFSPEEVKQAVWDCDSYKSPGPDGVSFGFIKEFWDLVKDDFQRFLGEFHRNGKLTKGLNSTFIHLIPKVNSPQRLNVGLFL
jgi:exonuclease III